MRLPTEAEWEYAARAGRTESGFLVTGNTSTGVIGVQTTHGHAYSGGISLLHDINTRLTLGGELYAGFADRKGLGRTQLQALVGGQYSLRNGMTFDFGLLGRQICHQSKDRRPDWLFRGFPGLPTPYHSKSNCSH